MRKWTNGSGADSTAAAMAYLATASQPLIYTLVKIKLVRWNSIPTASYGGFPCPFKSTWLLTDFSAAVKYNPLGTFSAAVLKHGALEFAVDVSDSGGGMPKGSFDLTWSPDPKEDIIPFYNFGGGPRVPGSSPSYPTIAGVAEGMFDGAYVWVYKVLMASPTDANTYGVCLLTMGLIDQVELEAGEIRFKCVDVISQRMQNIPAQLISAESRFAAADPLTQNSSAAERIYNASHGLNTAQAIQAQNDVFEALQPDGAFNGGVLVWLQGPLAGMRRAIRRSTSDVGAGSYTFYLATPFPFDASVYDSGFAFGLPFAAYLPTPPVIANSFYDGFPYVPIPEDGL